MTADRNPESIDFDKLLMKAIDGRLLDMNFCMPGIVKNYNRETQRATVQPALKRTYVDGRVENLAIINEVPIVFPQSKGRWVHFDLEEGSSVMLVFSQRSLDNWKESGGLVSPNDSRKFHLSDAIGIPGGAAKPDKLTLNGGEGSLEITNGDSYLIFEKNQDLIFHNSVVDWSLRGDGSFVFQNGPAILSIDPVGELSFTNGDLTFTLKLSGKVSVTNGTDELISVLSRVVDEIIGARTITMLGLQPLVGLLETFPLLKLKLESFKG